ncbi:transcriptional regulator [Candidatus Woesearchaeota archaeon CG1_02_57_44]|nr:MAG: transcriptional regulator [Candidatus Woesearchaeota archaeon CG1_02_57_44]
MSKRLFELHAEMCKVFSNPVRLEMLNILRDKQWSVTDLVSKTDLSQANVSQHLSIMKAKGIVLSTRKGKHVYYRIANPKIIKAFDLIKEALAETLNKQRYCKARG